jgi:hypothetical protein
MWLFWAWFRTAVSLQCGLDRRSKDAAETLTSLDIVCCLFAVLSKRHTSRAEQEELIDFDIFSVGQSV